MIKQYLSLISLLLASLTTYSMELSFLESLPLEVKVRIYKHIIEPNITNRKAFKALHNLMAASKSLYTDIAQSPITTNTLISNFAKRAQEQSQENKLLTIVYYYFLDQTTLGDSLKLTYHAKQCVKAFLENYASDSNKVMYDKISTCLQNNQKFETTVYMILGACYLTTPQAQQWLKDYLSNNPAYAKLMLEVCGLQKPPYDRIFIDKAITRFLLNALPKEAATYIESEHGITFLMPAAISGCIPSLKFLLYNGASLNHIDKHGCSTLSFAIGQPEALTYLLNTLLISKILMANNAAQAQQEIQNIGHSAIENAILKNQQHAVSLLTTAGVTLTNSYNLLSYAVERGNTKAVQIILALPNMHYTTNQLTTLIFEASKAAERTHETSYVTIVHTLQEYHKKHISTPARSACNIS